MRRGSAVAKPLHYLPVNPVCTAVDLDDALDAPTSSVYAAIERLSAVGIVVGLIRRARNQVWGARDILDELGVRIGDAAGR